MLSTSTISSEFPRGSSILVSVYLGSQVLWSRARFRTKVDGFVPRNPHVNLRIVTHANVRVVTQANMRGTHAANLIGKELIRLFSLKWPKSPWEIVFKFKLFSYKICGMRASHVGMRDYSHVPRQKALTAG